MIWAFVKFFFHRTGKNGRRARAEILARMPAREGRRPKEEAGKKEGAHGVSE